MLTFKQYTKAIDIWSVGCSELGFTLGAAWTLADLASRRAVIAEMISGRPLFPGRDYHHQLTLILEVLGTPSYDEFQAVNSRRSRDYLRAMPFRKKRPLSTLYPSASPEAIDLMERWV